MTGSLSDLPWLLPAPADFKARVRAALAASSIDPLEVRKLGGYALDLSSLDLMGKLVRKHRAGLIRTGGLTPFRLGIASSHTMDHVASALPGTALRHNLVVDVVLAGMGPAPPPLVSPESELRRADLDAILIAFDYRVLGLAEAQLSPHEAEIAVCGAIEFLTEFAAGVREMGTTCILQTLVPPASPLFGSLDGRVPGSVRAMIERFNEKLVYEVAIERDLVLDAAFLASAVGLSSWNHARDWNKSRLPCALNATPLYADHICRLLGAACGRARQCLVMDLDNTLWGGTLAKDGVEGISLGHGSSVGEAHVALQRYIVELRRRGVNLAVCSGDPEASVRLPFRKHPEMALREEHIDLFVANSFDTIGNIREIAAILNIGTDAVVYLDDDPAQRAKVRAVLAEVAVPELTADPADYAGLLSIAGYFEAAKFSREDMERASFFLAYSRSSDDDFSQYLESLEMVATVGPFNATSRSRITQLMNASGQLNQTGQNYSERDIESLQNAPDKFCLKISLADRFGDNGIVSILVFDRSKQEWRCRTWLTLCRVAGHRVEELALAAVARAALEAGAVRLSGLYLPTVRNGVNPDHFARLGFTRKTTLPDSGIEWVLDLTTYETPALPFAVVRPNGFANHHVA
jgi:FkbH-like protein